MRAQLADAGAAAKQRVRVASDQVTDIALGTKKRGHEIVTNPRTQVTVASAGAGAVAGGAAGGAVGTVAGAGTGALVGLPAALFTFGLSVPFCAAVGGTVGCAAGATTGGAAGGAVGGAAGYNAHKYRKEIAASSSNTWGKAGIKVGWALLEVNGLAMEHLSPIDTQDKLKEVRSRTQLLKAAAAKRLGRAAPEPVAQPAC